MTSKRVGDAANPIGIQPDKWPAERAVKAGRQVFCDGSCPLMHVECVGILKSALLGKQGGTALFAPLLYQVIQQGIFYVPHKINSKRRAPSNNGAK